MSTKRIEELANIKLNYTAVKTYVDKNGKPKKVDLVPEDEDFGLGQVDDLFNDEEAESDLDLDLEELPVDEDGDVISEVELS